MMYYIIYQIYCQPVDRFDLETRRSTDVKQVRNSSNGESGALIVLELTLNKTMTPNSQSRNREVPGFDPRSS